MNTSKNRDKANMRMWASLEIIRRAIRDRIDSNGFVNVMVVRNTTRDIIPLDKFFKILRQLKTRRLIWWFGDDINPNTEIHLAGF